MSVLPARPDGGPSQPWRRFAPATVLLVAVAASYGQVIVELVRDWIRDPNYSHGFLIPIVSGYVLWARRRKIADSVGPPSVFGFVGLALAAIMFVLGSAGAEVFTQRVSLVLLLASLVLCFYGWRCLRAVGFPIAFLLLAIPLPYVIYYAVTAPMQALAAKCAVWGLRACGVQAIAQGNMIHLSQVSLEVAEACSGIRSLYAFLALGALVAYFTSLPPWGRLAVFSTSIPLSVMGNAVRVWGSGMGAHLFGLEATRGLVHELFGVLVFVVCLGIFLVIKRIARSLWPSGTSSPSSSSVPPGSTRERSVTDNPFLKRSRDSSNSQKK